MKAMILAAGVGSRLGELGRKTPKCLVEAGGRMLLEYTMDTLKAAGVTTVVLNLHHLAQQVQDFVAAKSSFGIEVLFSQEDVLLDTGGGLRRACDLLQGSDPFLLYNGDVYCDLDLARVLAFHAKKKALATLVTLPTNDSRVFLFQRDGRMAGWRDRATGEEIKFGKTDDLEPRGYACIAVASAEFLDKLEGWGSSFSLIQPILAAARRTKTIYSYPADETYWIDIGTQEKLEALRARLL